ncbi:TraB/GumN family protein [Paraburkholderia sp. C35]|uniref:TraB/GumN family protein n=1 Tax=Paraburkholderia sp. C35 TaxID=2126993 RepID=UPI0013A5B2BE|nr:TraB/GumN family protein [Paraburkholderia sp. C35]
MWKSSLRLVGSRFVLMLALALCAMVTKPTSADEGVFWEASAPGRPVLLLMPTLHILPDPAQDIDAVLRQAIMRANSVVIESPVRNPTQAEQDAVTRMEVYPPSDSLENYFDVASLDALHVCAEKAHIPYSVFTRLKPWALAVLVANRLKAPPAYTGFEIRVGQDARAAHRNFAALLTIEEDMQWRAALPPRLQNIELLESCKRFDRTMDNQLIQDLANDWRQGDVKALTVDAERPMEPGDVPELKQVSDFTYAHGTSLLMAALLSERIQSMKGPTLVGAGGGHLVGPSSMLPRLEDAGYSVRRIELDKYPEIPAEGK